MLAKKADKQKQDNKIYKFSVFCGPRAQTMNKQSFL